MTEEKTKYCHHCGAMIPYMDRYCPACNAEQGIISGMMPVREDKGKSKWTAVILSFLITGLGQLYLGKRKRAAAFFIGTLILGGVISMFYSQEQVMGFGVLMAFVSAIDAYMIASRNSQPI
ncbi:MAG: TM2 domain-containing protein [Candidatus Bathyarchaeota archaeon]|nr:TM2 domain-containing protein [Candidatus Bathyarchaeota archaeon]